MGAGPTSQQSYLSYRPLQRAAVGSTPSLLRRPHDSTPTSAPTSATGGGALGPGGGGGGRDLDPAATAAAVAAAAAAAAVGGGGGGEGEAAAATRQVGRAWGIEQLCARRQCVQALAQEGG